MLRRFCDGICDMSASCSEEHELVRSTVHHVEEGLNTDCSIALKKRANFQHFQWIIVLSKLE